jgi:error-prone DNA polymerase
VNASRFDCTLEPTEEDRFAVRLGLRMVRGFANSHAAALIAARADEPFASIDDLWRRAGVPAAALVQLAEADAFRRYGRSRHYATSRCRSSLPHQPARQKPSRNSMSQP